MTKINRIKQKFERTSSAAGWSEIEQVFAGQMSWGSFGPKARVALMPTSGPQKTGHKESGPVP